MVEKTHLDDARACRPERVRVTSGELPLLFQGSVRGISAPLVASGQLFGAVNIEYPPGLTADVLSDERILIQLANQVAVAVRNAKLIDELTFVRKYLEELLENANALILVVNRDGRVVVFNGALVHADRLRARPRCWGTDVARLVPESERLKVMRVLDASLKRRAGDRRRDGLLGRDGREMRVAFATSAVTQPVGRGGGRHRHRAGPHADARARASRHPGREAGVARAARGLAWCTRSTTR